MRLDKYLKISRMIKRRTVASSACGSDRVLVNGNAAKSSYRVKIGDIIEIFFGDKSIKIEVLNISEHVLKADATALYREIE